MNPKEQITKIKEYADLADAGYAMLHYIAENEKAEDWFDNLLNLARKPPAKWIYADGIKRGYEVKEENLSNKARDNHRSLGQPTAYALAIEARFSQERMIDLDAGKQISSIPSSIYRNGSDANAEIPTKDIVKIDNKIQNLIKRDGDNPDLKNQKIQVSTTKEKMIKDETSHYLSTRTKAFTSRYEVVEHQKNTSYGFSATLFKDCENSNQLILVCRGTEPALEDYETDITLAQGDIPLQCYELAKFYEEKVKYHLGEEEKLLVIGHSLGGYLAQSFALMYPHRVKELYTFNAPGVLVDWSKECVKEQLESLKFVFFGLSPSKVEANQWLVRWIGEKLRATFKSSKKSFTINIQYNGKLPKELEKYDFFIQNLIDNITIARSNPDFIPPSLENAKILHIETTNTLDIQKHMNIWLSENTTQHLGKDIKGKYLFLYVSKEGIASHYLDCTLRTLYFYEYLLAPASNEKIFLKQGLQESFDALNTYHQNLGKYFYSFLEKVEGYINKKMMEKTKARDFRKPPLSKKLQALYLDISQKVEQTPMGMLFGLYLYFLDKKTEKKAMVETLFEEKNIIEIITSLKEESLFVRSIDNDRLKEYQKNIQKAQDDIAIRVALSTFAIFIFINQEDQSILTKEEFLSILGYSTPEIIIALADWDKDYLAFQAKTTRAFYFEGSVQVRA